jgi:hypothetical protein
VFEEFCWCTNGFSTVFCSLDVASANCFVCAELELGFTPIFGTGCSIT